MLLPNLITTKLVEKSHQIISLATKLVPQPIQNKLVLMQLNTLAKTFMEEGELDFMEEKVACIELNDIGCNWYFTVQGRQLKMLAVQPQCDVTFSAKLNALILMASQKVDPDTLFFNRDLKITGDTELGLEIKNLIDQFDLNDLPSPFRKLLELWSSELLKQAELAC